MSKSSFFKMFLAVIMLGVLSLRTAAQDNMTPPPPVNNSTFNMLVGTWKSEPYEMMGTKWTESAEHKIMHNGQYMFIILDSKTDKGMSYTATIIMSADKDGNVKGWSFDDWGSAGTYTGKTDGNKMTVTGKSDYGTETRDITIDGNSMVHKITWNMKGPDGKDMTMEQSINYKR